jgi:glyoxylate reductase
MKIFATNPVPGSHLAELTAAGHTVEIGGEITKKVIGIEGLITLLNDRVDSDLMDLAGPTLKIIANYAVGFDNIDIKAATDRGIVVTNTPCDEVNEAVAEHTWALILALTRRIVEADEAVRRGAFKGWEPDIFLGTSLLGKTLGIVGLGRIGSMVARRARGYNMTVLYNKHEPDQKAEQELGVVFSSLEDLLAKSDVVTLHVPLTDQTRGMVNTDFLSKMKVGSYLVNTARGPVVEEHALVQALQAGHIRGAALDVYEHEPNINPELIGMEQVVLTPHIASATNEARDAMSKLLVDSLVSFISGQKPSNIVNPEVWENRRK